MSSLRSLVYDLPTRLFHWLFAGLFVTAYAIANLAEHSPAFPFHMLAGLLLGGLLLLRLIWGVVGTRHARFGSFALSPRALLDYFRGVFGGGGTRWHGHNPASSWAALLMMALAAALAVTGLLMATGDAEAYEDVHELLANSFLVVALLHVTGVLVHTMRHRDGFPRSMVDGRKQDVPEEDRIARTRPMIGLVTMVLVAGAGFLLWNGYDANQGTLRIAGATLQLGENEAGSTVVATGGEHREDGDDD